jgi:hypothetical protein
MPDKRFMENLMIGIQECSGDHYDDDESQGDGYSTVEPLRRRPTINKPGKEGRYGGGVTSNV